jgi:hypothetical protein
MHNGLVIISILTLCNFLMFSALVVIVIKAKNQDQKSSFRQIPSPAKPLKLEQTTEIHKLQIAGVFPDENNSSEFSDEYKPNSIESPEATLAR